jgi:hypothetical protein
VKFTREPIIETIITPKEGYKLVVRSSKTVEEQEEFLVDAVEIVSFGAALFFRSIEKPKAFLVPVSDYEVLESKENRVVLKNAPFERTIKIGGGREAAIRRDSVESIEDDSACSVIAIEENEQLGDESLADRKRTNDRKKNRRRRAPEEREEMRTRISASEIEESETISEALSEVNPIKKPHLDPIALLKPPTRLVSESESLIQWREKYGVEHLEVEDSSPLEEDVSESQQSSDDKAESSDETQSETQDIKHDESPSEESLHASRQTLFSNLNDWTNFLS